MYLIIYSIKLIILRKKRRRIELILFLILRTMNHVSRKCTKKKGNRCINVIVEVMDGENKKDLLHYFF
jgi:hypothetical protein